MLLPSLVGNDRLKDAFSDPQAVESGCMLFSGPRGSGKMTAAFDIAMGLLCEGSPAPCGRCGPCVRMKAGSHPDYELFNPNGEEIKVDAVRGLRARSFIRPSEAERKVFVIRAADKMNVQGQNALLKVLEEPLSTVFILLCENSDSLLPTVRSRALHYRMQPLTQPLLREQLERRFPGASPAQLGQALEECGGYLGPAIELLSGGEGEIPALARDFVKALDQGELAVMTCCMELSKLPRDGYAAFCDELCRRLNQAVQQGAPSPARLLSLYDYVQTQKAKTAFNASVTALSGALAAFCGQHPNILAGRQP